MADEHGILHRVLQMRIRALGEPEQALALMRSTAPFYRAFGVTRVRFLQNVDDPAQFVIEVEYEAHSALELNRQKISSDPRVRSFLQGWKTLLSGAAEMDVYEDVTQ